MTARWYRGKSMEMRDRIAIVRDKIEKAASSCGRRAEDITLTAASKQNGAEAVRLAKSCGISVFGENRVQELLEKKAQGAYDGAEIRLIGHLQQNKVNKIVGACDIIESVDSISLMRKISDRALSLGIRQDILIEVNIAEEPQKSGISPAEADDVFSFAADCGGIFLKGLMAIPPADASECEKYNYFDAMRKLYVDMRAKKYDNSDVCILSMGMSRDYETAIRAGSNTVRIGTAIFGPRNY